MSLDLCQEKWKVHHLRILEMICIHRKACELPWQGHMATAEHTSAYCDFPYEFKKPLSSLFTFNLAYHHIIKLKI